MPRSIYQTGPRRPRQVQPAFRGRSGGGGGGGGSSSRFRNIWGAGGNEGNFAGFEFDRWQEAQRRGLDASQWAGGPGGVEGRFRSERRGIEDRARGDRRLSRRDRRFADIRARHRDRRIRREDRSERNAERSHQMALARMQAGGGSWNRMRSPNRHHRG